MIERVRRSQLNVKRARGLFALGLALCSLQASSATAEGQVPNSSEELRLIESTERNLDPLGLDDATGAGLEAAARAIKAKPVPPPVAQVGDVLTAIEGVFEAGHRVQIKLEAGLAFVEESIELGNRTRHAAEVAYRLRVPNDSVPWAFSVCRETRCASAVATTPAELARLAARTSSLEAANELALPTASLSVIRDGRGRAFALHVRALDKRPVSLRISYVSEAPLHGGRVRFTLPARGFDPRLTAALVQIEGRALSEISPRPELTLDASLPLHLAASWHAEAPTLRSRVRSRCAGAACSREYRAAAKKPVRDRETWLVLDVSPSMEGVARSRVPAVLAALLSQLPDDTRVRAFAFAAEAAELGNWPAIEVPLSRLGDALLADRGAATHLSSVLNGWHADLARERPRVIVISDGALDPDPREQQALARARRTGAELSLIALADDEPWTRLSQDLRSSGAMLHVTELADRAVLGGELDALGERLASLFSPRVAGNLRAGEGVAVELRGQTKRPGASGADFLPAWLARGELQPVWLSAGDPRTAAIEAKAYEDLAPPAALEATGMPKESVLDLLRTQLVPKARACLRADRKGRADYAVGLTFHFLIARREVLDASLEAGREAPLEAPLRACLLELLPRLRLPWFTGTLRVRYPIHTEREPEPPLVELAPEAAREVERALAKPPRRHRP